MLFTYDLLVPKNTLAASPVMEELRLVAGKVTEVSTTFPPGPAKLVHVQVLDSAHQIVPGNPEQDLNEDAATIVSRMDYPLQSPYSLYFKGWSDGTRYEHMISFYVNLEPAGGEDSLQLLVRLLSGSSGVLVGR
jgi:hypothetical protein